MSTIYMFESVKLHSSCRNKTFITVELENSVFNFFLMVKLNSKIMYYNETLIRMMEPTLMHVTVKHKQTKLKRIHIIWDKLIWY